MKRPIAILAGGYSGEYEVSVGSAATIAEHLDKDKFDVYTLLILREEWYYPAPSGEKILVDKNDFSIKISGVKIKFEAAFIAIHGTPGEDGKLQGYLEMLSIPYVGCGVTTSALTFNKVFCNKIVATLGIVKTATSLSLIKGEKYDTREIIDGLGVPLFVKPARSGSSIGVSKVEKEEDLTRAIEEAFRIDPLLLIEKNIRGREMGCGVYEANGEKHLLPVTEIRSSNTFFDYEAKYVTGKAEEITPAEIPSALRDKIQQTSGHLYEELNCSGIVRFDYIYDDGEDELWFLEVNTIPGQSSNSIIPQQIRAADMKLDTVYTDLLENCLKKGKQA